MKPSGFNVELFAGQKKVLRQQSGRALHVFKCIAPFLLAFDDEQPSYADQGLTLVDEDGFTQLTLYSDVDQVVEFNRSGTQTLDGRQLANLQVTASSALDQATINALQRRGDWLTNAIRDDYFQRQQAAVEAGQRAATIGDLGNAGTIALTAGSFDQSTIATEANRISLHLSAVTGSARINAVGSAGGLFIEAGQPPLILPTTEAIRVEAETDCEISFLEIVRS